MRLRVRRGGGGGTADGAMHEEALEVEVPRLDPSVPATVLVGCRPVEVVLRVEDGEETLSIGGRNYPVRPLPPLVVPAGGAASSGAPRSAVRFLHRGRPVLFYVETEADRLRALSRPPATAREAVTVTSPLPGLVRKVLVRPGERVAAGAPVVTLEAMKMENEVPAERAGVVGRVFVEAGRLVGAGDPLVRIDPAPGE